MKRLFTLILLLISVVMYSQKDTLFLYKNSYVIGDKVYSETINGIKQGKWIEWELSLEEVITINHVVWSGIDSLGNAVHGSYNIYKQYKPKSNYEDTPVSITPDTLPDGQNLILVYSWIAPEDYFISSKGKYKDGKKEGKWISYYQNNQIKKKIIFKKGIPIRDFEVFREDGSLMFSVKVLGDDRYKVCKYLANQNDVDCYIKQLEEISVLIQ